MTDKPKNQEAKETKETKGTGGAKGVKTSPKLEKLIGEIDKLSVLELSDLVKILEDKFGVSATPVAAAPAAAAVPSGAEKEKEEAAAKSKYNLILASAGAKKIDVIKAVREVNQKLGLKEAKDLVEAAPKEVLKEVGKEDAEAAKKKLEDAGATVELK